jgi:glucoamylase
VTSSPRKSSSLSPLEAGVPGYRVVNECVDGYYRIEKTIITDQQRDALLQYVRFVPLRGVLSDYRVFVLLAPHLDNEGSGNTAVVDGCKGIPMLFASRAAMALALACSTSSEALPEGARVCFTFYWTQAGRWEEADFELRVERIASA